MDQILEELRQLLDAGKITVNDARTALGLHPLTDGNVFMPRRSEPTSARHFNIYTDEC